jgi:hypothetical protein
MCESYLSSIINLYYISSCLFQLSILLMIKTILYRLSILSGLTFLFSFTVFAQQQTSDSTRFEVSISFPYPNITLYNANSISDSVKLKKGETLIHYGKNFHYFAKYNDYIYKEVKTTLSGNGGKFTYGNFIRLKAKNEFERDLLDATRFWKHNFFLDTDDDTEVFINNKKVGLGPSLLNVGLTDTLTVNNTFFKLSKMIHFKENSKALFEMQTINFHPNKNNLYKKMFIPGLYQFEKKQTVKASIISALALSTFINSISSYYSYNTNRNSFDKYNNLYLSESVSYKSLVAYREKSIYYQNKTNQAKDMFLYSVSAFAFSYVYNLFDLFVFKNQHLILSMILHINS